MQLCNQNPICSKEATQIKTMDAATIPHYIRKFNCALAFMRAYPSNFNADDIKDYELRRDKLTEFMKQHYPERRYSQRTIVQRHVTNASELGDCFKLKLN